MAVLQRFPNRARAGEILAHRLTPYAHRNDVVVLALPRGGVPVGYAAAHSLQVPLDVLIVRKLGVPGHEEYAMGALASGGLSVLNRDAIDTLGISMTAVEQARQRESIEIARREKLYRGQRPPPQLHQRCVILIDDGLATGTTMEVAIQAVRTAHPARVVVAVPVGAPDSCARLALEADELVCLETPDPFYAVGLWYEDFAQTSDTEVIQLLDAAAHEHGSAAASAMPQTATQQRPHPDGRIGG